MSYRTLLPALSKIVSANNELWRARNLTTDSEIRKIIADAVRNLDAAHMEILKTKRDG